jgi:hypothetical protein
MKKATKLILGISIGVIVLSLVVVAAIMSQRQKAAEKEGYCRSFPYYECPSECTVCPPCAECSSVACETEGFCESIGFGRAWYEDIKKRLNGSVQ